MIARYFSALFIVLASFAAHAQSALTLSHVQHFYAGGGGCADRFWLEWDGTDAAIRHIRIDLEFQSEGELPFAGMLRLDWLGVTALDRADEVQLESSQCPSGRPSLKVKRATANINGKYIDLLKSGMLKIGKVERYPIVLPAQSDNARAKK